MSRANVLAVGPTRPALSRLPGWDVLSALKSAFKTAFSKGNTVAACTRCPTMTPTAACLLTTLAPSSSFTMVRSLSSLSGGNNVRISLAFSWMPRKDKSVAGPSVLSAANGSPNSSQVAMVVAKAWLHFTVPGAPMRRKSSMTVDLDIGVFPTTSTIGARGRQLMLQCRSQLCYIKLSQNMLMDCIMA